MFDIQIRIVDFYFVLYVLRDYITAELSAFLHFTKAKHQQTLVGTFDFTKEGGGHAQFLLVCNLPSIYGQLKDKLMDILSTKFKLRQIFHCHQNG